jgi:hypothetical protein
VAAAVNEIIDDGRREVVVDRHGVEMPGEDDPLFTAQIGTGHHGVTEPVHAEVRSLAENVLDAVGDRLLVAGDRLDIDQRAGKHDRVDQHVGGKRVRHRPHHTGTR